MKLIDYGVLLVIMNSNLNNNKIKMMIFSNKIVLKIVNKYYNILMILKNNKFSSKIS